MYFCPLEKTTDGKSRLGTECINISKLLKLPYFSRIVILKQCFLPKRINMEQMEEKKKFTKLHLYKLKSIKKALCLGNKF